MSIRSDLPSARRRRRSLRPASAVVAAATLTAGLVACGDSATDPDSSSGSSDGGTPVVLTTFTVLADIAENVAGDNLQVESITSPGAEIHGYEPTPSDVAKASQADLILDNGMNLENWFKQFVQDSDAPHVTVTEGVDPIDITEDAYAGMPNPHAWMSPLNVQIYAQNMADAFADLDPDNAQEYQSNADAYAEELQLVQDQLFDDLAEVPQSQRALVTCEGAFSYLAADAGLEEAYIWPVNAEQEATPQQVAATIEFVQDNNVPSVFCESTVSDAPMQQVVEATDAQFGGTLYVDSLSEDGGPVPTYLDLIRHDAQTITAGLTGGADSNDQANEQ